jgi:hypothetical protein
MNLIILMLLSSAAVLFAQTQTNVAPVFSLVIEEGQLSTRAGYQPNDHELIVKYTNVSDTDQRDNCAVSPWEYKLAVLRDGVKVEKKVQSEKTEESVPPGAIRIKSIRGKTCGWMTRAFKPGESVKFPMWVSSEYDMTVPGTYQLTVTRETDPWNPEKSVTVKSNTLIIVVPEPEASAPQ